MFCSMLLTCRHDVARRGSADGAVVVAAVLLSILELGVGADTPIP